MNTSPPDQSLSRRKLFAAAGLGALALVALPPGEAKANTALIEATQKQIKFLRSAKRRARRIKSAKGRRIVIRNYNRAINDAKRRLRVYRRA